MDRFQPKYPPGEHEIPLSCPSPKCDHEWKPSLTVNGDGSLEPVVFRCPKCNRMLGVSLDWKVYVLWRAALGRTLGILLYPLLVLDSYIWRVVNAISVFVQKKLHLSKYLLALCSYIFGFATLFVLEVLDSDGLSLAPFGITALWTFYNFHYLRWCWRKVKEGDQEEGDILVMEDARMVRMSRSTRGVLLGMIILLTPLVLLSPDGFLFALFLINLGHYFVDSDFVPPSKRSVIEMGQRWVGGEA